MKNLNLFIIGILILCSCEPLEINISEIDNSSIQDQLIMMQEEGIMVDDVCENDDAYVFIFSNGRSISLNKEFIHFIDIREGSLHNSGVLPIVNEGYVDWTFRFNETSSVVFPKTLFSFNPDIIMKGVNHRGYSTEAPENTLPAYRLSKLKGFSYVETDVQFTKDGVPVLIHDTTVDRISNGNGAVKDMNWDEIQKLDFGQWKSDYFAGTKISTLDSFLELCKELDLKPYIELKAGTKELIKTIVDLVAKNDLTGRTTYISFSETLLSYVVDCDASATIGLIAGAPLTDFIVKTALNLQTSSNSVFIDSADYSIEAVELCQRYGVPLEVWTIDNESTIKSLSPYITGVTSDNLHAGRIRMVEDIEGI